MAENKLHATQIKHADAGLFGDGGGLYLKKQHKNAGQWHFRYSFGGKRVEMGLGGWPAISLADARVFRNKWRTYLKTTGKDPRGERDRLKRNEMLARGSTLAEITDEKFEAVRAGLKGEANAGRWRSPLDIHLLPRLGHLPIVEITQHDIASTLKPIWRKKAVTARKVTNRLSMLLDHAEAKGLPVSRQTVRAAVNLLGDQGHTTKHVPALAWADVPAYYAALGESPTELALRLLILTALRSAPIRHAHIGDIKDNVWSVPASHIKGKKGSVRDFEVPLSDEALRVIASAKVFERNGFLFPGTKTGTVISDMTLSQYMKRQGIEARPHGFRSSFRTWAAESTESPREVAEAVLGHVAGNAVEAAYQRGKMLEKRRVLMERWASFVTGEKGQVIRLGG